MIYVIIAIVYIIGCVVYCILNHDDIGTTELRSENWGMGEYTLDSGDIIMRSFFWPVLLAILIMISPILIGRHFLDRYHEKHTKNNS